MSLSYSDHFYARLAQEAIQAWKAPHWQDTYQECGVLVLGSMSHEDKNAYMIKAYENDRTLGCRAEFYPDPKAIRSAFSNSVPISSLDDYFAYLNRDGGWASSAQGVKIMIDMVRAKGGSVITGKGATKLLRKDGKTSGVKCADGTTYDADLVVLAAGSWTASAFSDLNLHGKCLATGQSVATIQLSREAAAVYRDCPVIWDLVSEFYMFPPNQDNIVKLGIHGPGYTHIPIASAGPSISTPRTVVSHDKEGLRIPKEMVQELRNHLAKFYPELAKEPFASTRLCWYCEQADEDWVIGHYPSDPSLVMATGGSGHAYKFLPVIGSVVADAIEGKLDPTLVKKFALDRECRENNISRAGVVPGALNVADLCSPEDLEPSSSHFAL
ncbi:hypothetical protein HWV62_44039 [Athelia sp. TMB]|nr:hypothetical protein HWV62_44039 [Athelia sp. TMB]